MRLLLACAMTATAALLTACAEVPGKPILSPISINPSVAGHQFLMNDDQKVSVSAFYSRVLRKGTHWSYFGSTDIGDIYRPLDTVFTVEAGNVYEAYLVVNRHQLVGYFLVVEKTIAVVNPVVSLNCTDEH